MPRNGDGSSDNGPIEAGENLIHGASGDVSYFAIPTLQVHVILSWHTHTSAGPLMPSSKQALNYVKQSY
jgi:hypothetical protein